MLDGLEAKEISLKNAINSDKKFRLDDEFYLNKYIEAYALIKSKKFIDLGVELDVLTDYHANGSYETLNKYVSILDVEDFAYMIRSTDLEKMNFVSDVKYVSEDAYNFLSKTKLYGGEVLINKIGSPGNVYLMPELNIPTTLGMNLFMLRMKSKAQISNYYLYAFLLSKIGQNIIYRRVNGTVPLTIDKDAIRSLPIPILSNLFQLKIKDMIKLSHQKLEHSKQLYKEAEELLLSELGLLDFVPDTDNIAIKSFSDSFSVSGRLDSEYYQPKYDDIINKIKNYHNGFEQLNVLLEYIDTGEYSEDYAIKDMNRKFYIRSTNISNGLVQDDENYYVEPSKFTKFVRSGDIITARVGTLGIFGTINSSIAGSVYSDNVLCFRLPSNLNPFVYTLYFNTSYNRMLIEKLSRGSVQQRLNQETLKDLIIPILDHPIQEQIEAKIKQSFALKEQSKQLLELAKRAVEVAIEESEQQAFSLINTVNTYE